MTDPLVNNPSDPLVRLIATFGAPESILAARESVTSVLFTDEQVQARRVRAVPLDAWTEVQQAYGDAISGFVRHGDLELLSLESPVDQGKFELLHNGLALAGDDVVTVRLEFKKARLLDRLFPPPRACRLVPIPVSLGPEDTDRSVGDGRLSCG